MTFALTELRTSASIDDSISGLHLDSSGQAAGDDIADGGGRFNRRNTNLSDETAIAQNKHFRIWLDPLPGTQIENNEIVSLIDCEHSAAHSNFSGCDGTAFFFLF